LKTIPSPSCRKQKKIVRKPIIKKHFSNKRAIYVKNTLQSKKKLIQIKRSIPKQAAALSGLAVVISWWRCFGAHCCSS